MLDALALSLALIAGDPAPDAAAAHAAAPAKAPAVDPRKDPSRIQCRYEYMAGSNRPIKECHTRQEWQEMSDNTHQLLQDRHTYEKDVANSGVKAGPQ